MPSSSQDVPFIVEQMARCVRLSKQCSDPEIAEKLMELARTFAQRAVELGGQSIAIEEDGSDDDHLHQNRTAGMAVGDVEGNR